MGDRILITNKQEHDNCSAVYREGSNIKQHSKSRKWGPARGHMSWNPKCTAWHQCVNSAVRLCLLFAVTPNERQEVTHHIYG